ncbi:type II secretion system F family protein [Candidatus Liberibacter sp.]|uniref:type II secretion system F family protein n=1 Tax=Candidatus Liberibacter sp. TaxID=34022 RepID=UPI0015F470E7|nr:type II secretion system F family protein [Candidatus Liberibacter sp.]MBA5723937.1 type II secretion system F family protein [Candidatus Liberibacter sp.]
MLSYVFSFFDSTSVLLALTVAVSVFSVIYALVLPVLERNDLAERMKAVSTEREALRQKQRMRLNKSKSSGLRSHENKSLRKWVDKLNLRKMLVDENTVNRMRSAGFRSEYALNILLLSRFILPCIFLFLGIIWIFGFSKLIHYSFMNRFFITLLIGYVGFYTPNLCVANLIKKRQDSIRRAWPDALDLLLICVESGISVDQSLVRVAEEVSGQSIPLSEEIFLTTAELSFLPNRQLAFENFYNRTQMDCVRNVMQAFIQADRYGTSIGDSLRILVEESRTERMTEIEKKAAALPPKLTVPMIIFFLPVLLLIILGPAILNIMDHFK